MEKERQMIKKFGGTKALFILFLITASFLIGSCSGGGSGSSSGSGDSGSGSVALLLADNPADDYESIWLYITKVILIPYKGSHYVLFESHSPEGYPVDLLKYREKDFLFTIRHKVPAGFYTKIRLEVSKVTAKADSSLDTVPCEEYIKLPSGKVDLNPRGGFYVRPGKTLGIRLDIDANKSFALHEAGGSGKCIFRPVVFVDIEPVYDFKRCPDTLKGEIDQVHSVDGIIDYFILDLDGNRRHIKIELSDRTRIFDEDGNFVDRTIDELKVGQTVRVRGWLTPKGNIRSSLIVIGDVLTISGTADDKLTNNTFPLLIDPGQELIGDSVDVLVRDQTLILAGCDTLVDVEAIQQYVRTEVIGKYDLDQKVLRSVAVLLKSFREVRGYLGSIEYVTGGYKLTLYDSDNKNIDRDPTFTIFLPEESPVLLLGDGPVPIGLLQKLVACKRREVIVRFGEDESKELVAQKVIVINETVRGMVVSEPILATRTLAIKVDDGSIVTVKVRHGAFFYKQGKAHYGGDFGVDFDDIKIGDHLIISGLYACNDPEADFYGFAVVILSSEIIM
jgi:hypothetical protein